MCGGSLYAYDAFRAIWGKYESVVTIYRQWLDCGIVQDHRRRKDRSVVEVKKSEKY